MNAPVRAPEIARRHRGQAGYTLIELIVATTIGVLVMSAVVSVLVTSIVGVNTATTRVEASSQIRSFQLTAYDDFALSRPPAAAGCGTPSSPCTTQPMVLSGSRVPNQPTGAPTPFTATYTWDPAGQTITRSTGVGSRTAAGNVTAFEWYVDSSGQHPVVVVAMSVTVGFYNTTYTQSQTLLFYPRITS
jgi:prepilin-type N-terminal cleavage/methylation domain-containing protein